MGKWYFKEPKTYQLKVEEQQMNVVILSGRLGREPEIKNVNGKTVANFSIAISMGKDLTEWVNIVAWEKTAEFAQKWLKKGSGVEVNGRLCTRSWEKDGTKRYATEVIANNLSFPPGNNKETEPKEEAVYLGPELDIESIPF
jgi:single-strand DNA-binding protein